VASLLLAAFSLTLPHTPPRKVEQGSEKLAWVQAGRLLRHPFVLVLWLVTFVDATVQNSYFVYASTFLGSQQVGIPGNWVMPVMSLGQIAEILTMLILGLALKRLGWRVTMIIGVLGHTARFAVFAFLPQYQGLVIAVNLLHGVCYAFFFATVYIFAEEFFPKDVRASAQGLFNVMILGLGPLLAYSAGPWIMTHLFTVGKVVDFRGLFLVPCGAATLAAIILALFFRPPVSSKDISMPAGAKPVPVER
jgi:MFS family permease